MLRVYDSTLVLETMFWPDEIRSTGALDLPEGDEARVRPKELQMAESLVKSLAGKFEPEQYTDAHRRALEELIERKMSGERRNAKRRKSEPKVIDLMEALQAGVEGARGRGAKARKTKSPGTKRAPRRRRQSAA